MGEIQVQMTRVSNDLAAAVVYIFLWLLTLPLACFFPGCKFQIIATSDVSHLYLLRKGMFSPIKE